MPRLLSICALATFALVTSGQECSHGAAECINGGGDLAAYRTCQSKNIWAIRYCPTSHVCAPAGTGSIWCPLQFDNIPITIDSSSPTSSTVTPTVTDTTPTSTVTDTTLTATHSEPGTGSGSGSGSGSGPTPSTVDSRNEISDVDSRPTELPSTSGDGTRADSETGSGTSSGTTSKDDSHTKSGTSGKTNAATSSGTTGTGSGASSLNTGAFLLGMVAVGAAALF